MESLLFLVNSKRYLNFINKWDITGDIVQQTACLVINPITVYNYSSPPDHPDIKLHLQVIAWCLSLTRPTTAQLGFLKLWLSVSQLFYFTNILTFICVLPVMRLRVLAVLWVGLWLWHFLVMWYSSLRPHKFWFSKHLVKGERAGWFALIIF